MTVLADGYKIIEQFLPPDKFVEVDRSLDRLCLPDRKGGIRNAEKRFSVVGALVESQGLKDKVGEYLNAEPHFVRAIVFNKTLTNNWLVSWHQDKTVSVSKRFEDPTWGPWSSKGEVLHVQPPVEVLNQMVTIRIHLDDSNSSNGCLSVIPNSHTMGLLSQSQVFEYTKCKQSVLCEARAGSALVMRPHLLHSSSKGTVPNQRRILHIEYSSYNLPEGVRWK